MDAWGVEEEAIARVVLSAASVGLGDGRRRMLTGGTHGRHGRWWLSCFGASLAVAWLAVGALVDGDLQRTGMVARSVDTVALAGGSR
jgi:hypothetical protein